MKELQNLMSIGDVAKSFGVCVATVRRWCKNGKFSRVIRTLGNQRRFDPDEVHELLHPNLDKRIMVGYARVSSYDQRSDGSPSRKTQPIRMSAGNQRPRKRA